MTEEKNLPAVRGGNSTSVLLNPAVFEHCKAVAEYIAKSNFIPDVFRNKPYDCMRAVVKANQLGMDSYDVMDNTHVVHGKLGYTSQFQIECLSRSGFIRGPLRYRIERDGNGKIVSCAAIATSAETGDEVEGPPVTADVVKAEGWLKNPKWTNIPELMYRYRAATFLIRTSFPGVRSGQTVEEIEDTIIDVRAEPASTSFAIPSAKPAAIQKLDEALKEEEDVNPLTDTAYKGRGPRPKASKDLIQYTEAAEAAVQLVGQEKFDPVGFLTPYLEAEGVVQFVDLADKTRASIIEKVNTAIERFSKQVKPAPDKAEPVEPTKAYEENVEIPRWRELIDQAKAAVEDAKARDDGAGEKAQQYFQDEIETLKETCGRDDLSKINPMAIEQAVDRIVARCNSL